MKKIFIPITIILLVILLSIGGVFIAINLPKKNYSEYFANNTESSSILSLVSDQESINKKLNDIASDNKYTIDNPYIELNPYKISPLSAIIIFTTSDSVEVKLSLNDEEVTTTPSETKHVIPLYGLLNNHNNTIKLTVGDTEYNYAVKTENNEVKYPLNVETKSATLNKEELYFLNGPVETGLTGWDIDGNLRFYLTYKLKMDVEWLDNGHFIIGTPQDTFRDKYMAFVEMDYLGKVYNYYTCGNSFDFESQILSNGNYMIAGGDQAIYFDHQMIYELDPTTGKTVSSLDIYDVIKKIDPDFKDDYLGPKVIRNGFYYNEETEEVVVSFREINTILSFNYKDKTLNWIFTDPSNEAFASDVWDTYFLSLNGGSYPLGQHSPQITKEGYLAFYDNKYNRMNIPSSVAGYQSAYSEAEVFKIEDKKATLIWTSANVTKDYFNQKYGLFRVTEDNHKLINFGWVLHDEYMNNTTNTFVAAESDLSVSYAVIMEIDGFDNVIFKATTEEGKYRVFKHTLYNEETSSINPSELNYYNSIEEEKKYEVDINAFSFLDSDEWIYTTEFTKNTFTTNYETQENDIINLYFVSDSGKCYMMNYKKEDGQTKRIFDLELKSDKYALYIELNGTMYNPHLTINY